MLKRKSMRQNRITNVDSVEKKYETINQNGSGCRKLAQKYKTQYDWVGKGTHWELRKRLNYDHTTEHPTRIHHRK